MIKASFELEKKLIAEGYNFIVGIDEVGRGPLAGPVVACAVALRNFQFSIFNFQKISNEQDFYKKMELIRDSKMLSEKQRESLFDFIRENFYFGIGICDHNTIDRVNILEASFLAMKSALSDLMRAYPHPALRATLSRIQERGIILIDGNKKIPNFSMEQRAIVGGDKLVKSISAASIIAKVTRDRMMKEMHEKYPQYNFEKHKGYGTKFHMEALKKHGPCEIHRRSFRPVRKCLLRGD